jgi:hypothetical protein
VDREIALDWTWSSQLTTHIQIGSDEVIARQVATAAPLLRFNRSQVEQNLEAFFDVVVSKRIEPQVNIADHIVSCFRAHRQAAFAFGLDRSQWLRSFLEIIEEEISGDPHGSSSPLGGDHKERVREELRYSRIMGRRPDFAVTMRHAAGMVFQETHAELAAEPLEPQLFGLAALSPSSTRNRLGAYYTPPGLARILADLVVADHLTQHSLRIVDPACGSGIFLCEVLRALERKGFQGHVELIGYDTSADAIAMADFALRHNDAQRAFSKTLEVQDFLSLDGSLEADIILMNPPFLALPEMPAEVRNRLQDVLGESFRYRPDLSMAFTSLGLLNLKEGGTLATLLPSGALSQQGGGNWRESVLRTTDVELIAVLGDHGMFRDAMVNIAALVVHKTTTRLHSSPVMLWASQKRGASSSALRRLRRWYDGSRQTERTLDWSIYNTSQKMLVDRPDWTPRPYSLGDLPVRLASTPNIATVHDLFHVELGIRVGNLKPYLQLDVSAVQALPAKERALFRPVAETRSIRHGRVEPVSWLFYPKTPLTTAEIAQIAPRFFQRHLSSLSLNPNARVDLERARRATNLRASPRIVARAFLSTDSFAVDLEGAFVVVQGYSWLPKRPVINSPFPIEDILRDYCFVFNSRLFFALLRENGRIVAGGQVDGAKSQISRVSVPDLPALYLETPELELQARELRSIDASQQPSMSLLDRFAAAAFRTSIAEWTIGL